MTLNRQIKVQVLSLKKPPTKMRRLLKFSLNTMFFCDACRNPSSEFFLLNVRPFIFQSNLLIFKRSAESRDLNKNAIAYDENELGLCLFEV